jgi:hypothetical protein
MNDKDVIAALGGAKTVAECLGLPSFRNVRNWERRGIAAAWRPAVMALATKRGLRLQVNEFLRIPTVR